MTRILWINPVGTDRYNASIAAELQAAMQSGSEVRVESLNRGPSHLEYNYFEALVIPDVVHRVVTAEREGYDAAIIGCFADPGVREAREVTKRIAVVGPCESSLHLASLFSERFAIVVGRSSWIPKVRRLAADNGLLAKLVATPPLGMGVHDLQEDPARTLDLIVAASEQAISGHSAQAIVLGCTVQFGLFRSVAERLGGRIPVIDPVVAAAKCAELMVELWRTAGWRHCDVDDFTTPSAGEIGKEGIPDQYRGADIW